MTARPPGWTSLDEQLSALAPAPLAQFRDDSLDGAPDPVRRWLRAAIADGSPCAPGAWLRMTGSIRLGRWLPFRAEQLLAPRLGTVWVARVGGVITGSDQSVSGHGAMDWRVLGRIPLVRADGPDIDRSAAGRVAGESIWVPTAMLADLDATVRPAGSSAVAVTVHVAGQAIELTHHLDGEGRIVSSNFLRWGDPKRTGTWSLHPFGVEVTGYRTFGGVSIPAEGRAGWHHGTLGWPEGEFFRFRIEDYRLMPVSGSQPRPVDVPSVALSERGSRA